MKKRDKPMKPWKGWGVRGTEFAPYYPVAATRGSLLFKLAEMLRARGETELGAQHRIIRIEVREVS